MQTKELMGVFSDKGVASTVKAHYVAADGSQDVVISAADDLEEAYRNILNYAEWIDYDTKPYLTIEQAVAHIVGLHRLMSGLSAGGGPGPWFAQLSLPQRISASAPGACTAAFRSPQEPPIV